MNGFCTRRVDRSSTLQESLYDAVTQFVAPSGSISRNIFGGWDQDSGGSVEIESSDSSSFERELSSTVR